MILSKFSLNVFLGAFLIPYTLMLIFIGAPVFYMELALGQFTSAGPLVVWKVNPLLRGILEFSLLLIIIIIIVSILHNEHHP